MSEKPTADLTEEELEALPEQLDESVPAVARPPRR